MRRLILPVALALAPTAHADLAPPTNSRQCMSAKPGAPCTTDDGQPGTCVAQADTKTIFGNLLICAPSASATARAPATTPVAPSVLVFAAVLGLLAMTSLLVNSRSRKRPREA